LIRYAFVVHRSYSETEKNRRRPINYRLLGSECCVENVDKDFHAHYEKQPFTIVVTHIPENVNENELRNMFVNCQSLKYYPGRTAHFMQGKSTRISHNKILSGYVVEIEIVLLEHYILLSFIDMPFFNIQIFSKLIMLLKTVPNIELMVNHYMFLFILRKDPYVQ
jgi:hypothetical protein